MALFDDVFNRVSIYDMLFFNVKAVLEHPTLGDLEAKDKPMFERWKFISKTKHNCPVVIYPITDTFTADIAAVDMQRMNEVYCEHAIKYPEFSKIVAITYASLYLDGGSVKRDFKKIVNLDEKLVIDTFMAELHRLSSEGVQSSPVHFPVLCGHNVMGYDIPLLIKRYIKLNLRKDEDKEKPVIENKQLPLILKKCLNTKPWESSLVIDTTSVWKFNGTDNTPLMLIADYLGLKKTVDVLPLNELSMFYWDSIDEKPRETLDYVALQSATQTNLVLQLINELRQY